MCIKNISAHERGEDTCTKGEIKSGMSLCLEKASDEETEGGIWNEGSWGVVEGPGNKDGRGWFPGSLAEKQRKQISLASTYLKQILMVFFFPCKGLHIYVSFPLELTL